jgi:hypothetical protein
MRIISRSAIIVQPKAPLLAWLHSLDPPAGDLSLAEVQDEPIVYLMSDCDNDKAFEATLKRGPATRVAQRP